MKAVLFARVSSKEQEEAGYSLPAQEKFLKEYADKHRFEVIKVFSISESASGRKEREIFNSMMSFVRKEDIRIIVCEKVDRLTRNFKDAVMIDEWLEKNGECQVHLVKDSLVLHKNARSQEKLNWGIRVLLAKNYIDNLSEEVKKGQKEKIEQGWLPTKPPLGYKTTGEDGHKIHIVDEEKAPLVRIMFEWYASGAYSTKVLCEKMYKEGLRTQMGNKLVRSRLHDHLSNPFYYGKLLWNDELYDGKHEPLITKEIFDRVQSILHGKTTPKNRRYNLLFQGMIKCFECGGAVTWETHKGITYGHCNHYRDCRQETWSREDEIENQLLGRFDNLQIKSPRLTEWIRKALKESHQDKIVYHEKSLSELQARQEQIRKRRSKLYDDKVDGVISLKFYGEKIGEYREEYDNVTSAIQKHSNADNKYYELGVNFYEISQRAREIFSKANVDEKRQLIRLVFSELVVDEGRLITTYSKPFQLLSTAVLATNQSSILRDLEEISKNSIELSNRYEKRGGITDSFSLRPNWLPG